MVNLKKFLEIILKTFTFNLNAKALGLFSKQSRQRNVCLSCDVML